MKIHDATEYAYKNGYRDGAKAFADKICDLFPNDKTYTTISRITVKRIATELTERKEDEGK